jgi:hypothetical protein
LELKGEYHKKNNEIPRIITECFKNLHFNKLENLDIMDKFLDTWGLPKLNKQYINNLNRSKMSSEVEAIIVFQQNKVKDCRNFLVISTGPNTNAPQTTP